MTSKNEEALNTYIDRVAKAKELADSIALYIDDHGEVAPDDVTWNHVGSMGQLIQDLEEIEKFIHTGN